MSRVLALLATAALTGCLEPALCQPTCETLTCAREWTGAPLNDLDPAWPSDDALPPDFDLPPYLTLPAPNVVSVGWRTPAATAGEVRYGPSPAYGLIARNDRASELHHVDLEQLSPATAYWYEEAIDGTTALRRGVFVTPGRDTWRLAQLAEFHSPSQAMHVAAFAGVLRNFRPHLIIDSGDMADDGRDFAQWRTYLRTSASWISNAFLLPTHSNHVNGACGNANLLELFRLPGNGRWYPTRYGSAEILTLDSTFDGDIHGTMNDDVGAEQIPWLRRTAAAAHDGASDPNLLIAAWHYPACSSHYASRFKYRQWVQGYFIAPLLAAGGVDLVLVGHDKYSERSFIRGGITQVQTNAGMLSPGDAGGNDPHCSPQFTRTDTRTIMLGTISGATLSGSLVETSGEVLDSFVVGR